MLNVAEQRFRLQLVELLKKDAGAEAVTQLTDRKIDKLWCDKAVAVYVRSGQKDKAHELVAWAKANADVITWHNCLIEYANALMKSYFASCGKELISFGQASLTDREILKEVISTLSPIVEHVKADDRVSNPLELKALLHTINATIILGETASLNKLASILKEYRPIPFEYVRMVLSGLVPPDTDIPRRIYSEYKDNFEAHMLALVAEADLCGNAEAAFKKGKQFTAKASTDFQKESLCGTLFQISQQLGIPAMEEAHTIAADLLGADATLTIVIAAAAQLRERNTVTAKSILEAHKEEDNAQWLQTYAHCLFSEDNFKEGLTYFSKALEKLPSSDMYLTLGEVAARGGFVDKAIVAFETILKASPNDETARVKTAQLYLKANDYQGAEGHLKRLWEGHPENSSYGMNYAACMANQGRLDDAIGIYKILCKLDKPPVEAVVAVAQLYKSRHQPDAGFRFLEKHKSTFWDSPGFLMAYVDAGYASDHEVEAHEAFSRVMDLRAKGKAPPDIVQPKSLDDLLQYHRQWNERTELICNNILQGKCPWIMADALLSHAVFTGWTIRTQPLMWLGDDANSRASYSIYSTNGFHAKEVDSRRSLEPLALPVKGSKVITDLSALATLQRLGLLEKTREFFGTVYVSTRYTSHLLAESGRLEFHQLSHVKSTKLMKRAIDSASISVLADAGIPGTRPYPYVHEYTDDGLEHYYRLRDICKVLHDAGKISGAKNTELLRIAGKPSGVDDKHQPLQYSQQIIVELSTLRTLINFDAYGAVKDSFKLSIMPEAKKSLDADLQAMEYQEECQRWHDYLIKELSKFEALAPNYSGEDAPDICMDSYYIAKSKGLSVLVDDRVIQALALNDEGFKASAFGVDCLLKAFEREKALEIAECDSAYLQLIKWRYRFLVPSVDFLVRLAKRYEANAPGNELMEVAGYVHECMRDPGLFSGLEKTDPPQPMCGRLFTAWADLTMRFIVDLWEDSDVSPETASAFTRWAFRELLPSPPRAFVPQRIDVVDLTGRLFFEKLLGDLATLHDMSRAKTAVAEIRKAFCLTDEEYYRMLTETLDLTAKKNDQTKD